MRVLLGGISGCAVCAGRVRVVVSGHRLVRWLPAAMTSSLVSRAVNTAARGRRLHRSRPCRRSDNVVDGIIFKNTEREKQNKTARHFCSVNVRKLQSVGGQR